MNDVLGLEPENEEIRFIFSTLHKPKLAAYGRDYRLPI